MKKNKFHITLITNGIKDEYNLLGEYDKDKNIISYYESNVLKSKLILDLNNKTLIKENIDYKITLKFKEKEKTLNEILLKKEDNILNIELETIKYLVNNKEIEIIYKMIDSNEIIEYKIEIGD